MWAARHRSGQSTSYCPICVEQSRSLPVFKRRPQKLVGDVCPLHGRIDLHPGNQQAWRIWTQHNIIRFDAIQTGKTLLTQRRLDYLSIDVLFRVYRIAPDEQADLLEQLEWLFADTVKQPKGKT